MLIEEFDFDLPHHLIAQAPLQKRDSSRLLVLNKNTKLFSDKKFVDFVDLLNTNDLLIFNDTRVIKARLFGKKITGGKVEIMIERILDDHHALAHLKTSKKIVDDNIFEINKDVSVKVIKKENDLFYIEFNLNLLIQISANLLNDIAVSGDIMKTPVYSFFINKNKISIIQLYYVK